MPRAGLVCLVALLCICGAAVAGVPDELSPPVELAQGGSRVRVWETFNEFGKDLHVKATRDGRTAVWRYNDLELDPETGSAAAVEVRELHGVPFLFVHDYSGGASCCWSLLVFDLAQFKPLGEMPASGASIQVRRKVAACGLEAEYWPTNERPGESSMRCFDGTTFRKVTRKSR